MNRSHFLGKLTEDPVLWESHSSVSVGFTLEVEEYRRGKDGSKKRRTDLLNFEAWDTAAKTIEKYAYKGDIMAVEAIARNQSAKDPDVVIFRVTNFKIIPDNKP